VYVNYLFVLILIVKFLEKYADEYVHLNNTVDFRDTYNMTKPINVFIIRNTHSTLHIKHTQVGMIH
jgi:hypothetical protein